MKRLALLPVLAFAALAAPQSALQKHLEGQAKKIDACLLKMDMAGFEKLVRPNATKDFKHVENGRSLNLDQTIAQMKSGLVGLKKLTKVESKFLSFKQTGNTAVAKQSHLMAGILVGPDKKEHMMAYSGVSMNTYRKEGGVWKMAIMDWKATSMTLDGKPFDPSKASG